MLFQGPLKRIIVTKYKGQLNYMYKYQGPPGHFNMHTSSNKDAVKDQFTSYAHKIVDY